MNIIVYHRNRPQNIAVKNRLLEFFLNFYTSVKITNTLCDKQNSVDVDEQKSSLGFVCRANCTEIQLVLEHAPLFQSAIERNVQLINLIFSSIIFSERDTNIFDTNRCVLALPLSQLYFIEIINNFEIRRRSHFL